MFEGDARDCYSRKTESNKIVAPGLLIHSLITWLGFSADGIICAENKPICLWECKTPKAGTKNKAENITKLVSCMNKKTEKLKERHPYYGQVQLGMLKILYSCTL